MIKIKAVVRTTLRTATRTARRSDGFTLVEMAIIAPIVVLLIGTFIGLIIAVTGNVMSTRGKNLLVYDTQDALNRIEEDVRLSTTFRAVNNIDVSSTGQGYGDTTSTGSTTNFTNITPSSSLILNILVTDSDPLYDTSNVIYRSNQPNDCTSFTEYSKNTPMTANVVYFVSNGSLWRRVIMPSDYATSSAYCGSNSPWQLPTCASGYSSSRTFCKANDEELLDGIADGGFTFQYYSSASSTTANTAAVSTSSNNATRDSALQASSTVEVTLSTDKTIAGNEISHSANIRATRLDANASTLTK